MSAQSGDRLATPDDVDTICAALPGTEFGTSWGDRPTWLVHGRGFLLHRAPRHDAVDPVSGVEYDDLLVITTPGMAEKEALVADPATPFFTIDHFNRSSSVLVQQARLGELTLAELEEVLTDAWAARAPRRLVKEHLGDA